MSVWGLSWLKAWGNAWGSIFPNEPEEGFELTEEFIGYAVEVELIWLSLPFETIGCVMNVETRGFVLDEENIGCSETFIVGFILQVETTGATL